MGLFGSPVVTALERVSGFWNMFRSLVGLEIPATVVVLKTDTNKFFQLAFLFLMFVVTIIAWLYIHVIIANMYARIIEAIAPQGIDFQARIMAFISMVVFPILCSPMTVVCSCLAYFLLAAILSISDQRDVAALLYEAIVGGNRPAIAHRP
jgi:hypothetical protein